jgi:UDP-glucose-4-epimerase GalE
VSAVLVTGGAGYIGSHTAKALRRAGYDVVIYDDLSAGHRAAALGAPLVEGDVHDGPRVATTLREHRVEAVMHFAAWLSVGDSVTDPRGYYWNNVGGTLALLEAMTSAGVTRLVFSSSAAVFGDPVETPIAESHPTRPVNAYGETKLAIERALPHYERAYGLRSMSLRYFNAAGADPQGQLGEDHEPETHLVPRAIDAALGGEPLHVFGDDYATPDGTCLRDYVHVTDLAAAHVLALRALESGAPTGVYNLGAGRPVSVREVIAAVERVTGRKVPSRAAPRRAGDPAVLFASSGAIARDLGWRPEHGDLETIVRTAWQWREAHPRGYAEGVET